MMYGKFLGGPAVAMVLNATAQPEVRRHRAKSSDEHQIKILQIHAVRSTRYRLYGQAQALSSAMDRP